MRWSPMPRRPNFLIFMTDQQRGAVVLDGARYRAFTPHLDAFRRRAVTFREAYCPAPHCCPSRASFFTGEYPSRHGVWNNVNVGNALSRGPFARAPFWSRELRAAGYGLTFSGKWHVSDGEGPADYGWEEAHVTAAPRQAPAAGPKTGEWQTAYRAEHLAPRDDRPRAPGEIRRPGYPAYVHYGTRDNPFGDDTVVAAAIAALRARAAAGDETPWCHYVGTLGPHDPYTPPERFLALYSEKHYELPPSFADTLADKPALYRKTRRVFDQLTPGEHRDAIRHYLAFCTYEDHLFGELLAALEATGQAENTVVVFVSDHGDYLADHGLWCKGLPCFRGAYHVPCVIGGAVPGLVAGRAVDAFVSLVDFAPTILELAGGAVPPARPEGGRSLVPWLRGETPAGWRDAIFTQTNGNELYGIQRSITTRRWKYVYNGFDEDELYDLAADPDEMRNLAADPAHRATVEALMTRLWRFARAHDDVCINPYIMVGHAPVGPGVVVAGEH
jgi:choline-sulfatase